MAKRRIWPIIRAIWVTAGLGLMAYLVLSFQAWGVDEDALRSGARVEVAESDESISFLPRGSGDAAGLVFVPGGMVDPQAYAPLLRPIAEAGHAVILVKLPSLGGRHAFGEEGRAEAARRVARTFETAPGAAPWLLAGHSLGGAIAARVARNPPPRMAGLALLATTHPRDFSLAGYGGPVTKIYATRDGIAPLEKMKANAANLPLSTRWIAIEGGNHSQFGHYGFQLLDGRATISREAQQEQVRRILMGMLEETGAARLRIESRS